MFMRKIIVTAGIAAMLAAASLAGATAANARPFDNASLGDVAAVSQQLDRMSPDAKDAAAQAAATAGPTFPGQKMPGSDTRRYTVPVAAATAEPASDESGVSTSDVLLGVGIAGGLALLVLFAMRGTKSTRPTLGSS